MEECEFSRVARILVMHILSYPHLIVFECIQQSACTGKLKKYMSIEDICHATSLHTRDAMKYIVELQRNHCVEMCTSTINKRRIQLWGIQYHKMFNFIHAQLKKISENMVQRKNQTFCSQCQKFYDISECLNEQYETFCPIAESHDLMSDASIAEKNTIHTLITQIESIKDSVPIYTFSYQLNRSSIGDDLAT